MRQWPKWSSCSSSSSDVWRSTPTLITHYFIAQPLVCISVTEVQVVLETKTLHTASLCFSGPVHFKLICLRPKPPWPPLNLSPSTLFHVSALYIKSFLSSELRGRWSYQCVWLSENLCEQQHREEDETVWFFTQFLDQIPGWDALQSMHCSVDPRWSPDLKAIWTHIRGIIFRP